ncbi:MAG: hypothetical protein HY534_01885 [Chloroflexi bacterium]|nr:hypothetical protein [Betaproteobacteria bacterium]MBI4213034.1 hypothetical protein [Chloroflexota bacterium]
MTAGRGGPFINAALICEKVLREHDGVLTPVRVVDRFLHRPQVASFDQPMPPAMLSFSLLVVLKSGDARGRYTLRVRLEDPSGLVQPNQMSQPVHLEGEERGINAIFEVAMQFEREGLYWFAISLDDTELTRVPLRLVYEPVQAAS